jgi:hypothetical protein
LRRTVAEPSAASSASILALQRAYGNRAVTSLIQTKLKVGPAHDRYEQEADRVADQVMGMPAPAVSLPANGMGQPAQRQADEEEAQAKPLVASINPLLQRQEEEELQADGGFEAGPNLESRLAARRGGGSPLSGETRAFMESRFGADFSGVRVHADGEAAQLNRQISAQAFTHRQDIYVGEGKYDPGSDAGKRLLAHELTHVVQQTGSTRQQRPAIQRKVTFKLDDDPAGPDVTIEDYTPAGQEKTAVDEAVGYIDAGTKVEEQAWAKARIQANSGKVPNAVKKFRWEYPHRNRDGDLPGKKNAGGYLEYYVRKGDNTTSGEHPKRRIVIRESDGKKFYTNTHYGDQGAPPFYELKQA